MKIKHIDTPYWLRNRRDTVQNPNRKRKFAGVVTELEVFTRTVDEQIVDHNGNPIIDNTSANVIVLGRELQYRALVAEYSTIIDSAEGLILSSQNVEIVSKKIIKQNITNQ